MNSSSPEIGFQENIQDLTCIFKPAIYEKTHLNLIALLPESRLWAFTLFTCRNQSKKWPMFTSIQPVLENYKQKETWFKINLSYLQYRWYRSKNVTFLNVLHENILNNKMTQHTRCFTLRKMFTSSMQTQGLMFMFLYLDYKRKYHY